MSTVRLSMQKLAGTGYGNGWYKNCRCRYRVFAGARNTKKSYDILGLEVLCKIIENPYRNILILRQIGANNRYSTFSTIMMLIHEPDPTQPWISLDRYFKVNTSTMTITYRPTGQQIIFAGMYPDPTRITSMRMPRGYLTDVYVEEAFEMKDYDGWRRVDGTIRGKLPNGLFHQITFCLNTWNKSHWIYDHFFKGRLEDDLDKLMNQDYIDYKDEELVIDYGIGLYLHKSTYKINEFRDKEIYDVAMEELRRVAPEIYKVEALGMWGNSTEATYPEMNDSLIVNIQEVMKQRFSCFAIGIDTGLSDGDGRVKKNGEVKKLRSATTMQMFGITMDYEKAYCIDEYFFSNENQLIKKTEPELQTEIIKTLIEWQDKYRNHIDLMRGTTIVYVDSADKGYRQGLELEARKQGLFNVVFMASAKTVRIVDRVMFIRRIMAYGEYLICNQCQNLIRELKNSRQGDKGEIREDIDDHAINANEYAWIPIINRMKRWKDFKSTG